MSDERINKAHIIHLSGHQQYPIPGASIVSVGNSLASKIKSDLRQSENNAKYRGLSRIINKSDRHLPSYKSIHQ